MKKKEFIHAVASLTAAMFIIQSSSMAFAMYASSRFGSAQMGLIHLIMSVYGFAVTVSLSGVPLAATRLVSETALAIARASVIRRCLALSIVLGVVSGGVLALTAPICAEHLLGNTHCAVPLRILAVSLPFISVSGAIRGYFTGVQRVSCITASRMTEEFAYMLVVIILMRICGTLHTGVIIAVTGITISAILACMCDIVMYSAYLSRMGSFKSRSCSMQDILAISAPVAAGSYLRSGLVAAENLLIPSALSKSGVADAISQYGTIKAMAMPMVTFPYVFLQSLTSLLVPEISGRNALSDPDSVRRAARMSINCTLIFAVIISALLFIFGGRLSIAVYSNDEPGRYIVALSLLAVPMYIDSVTDSILKGLGEQVYSLKVNIIDSAVRVPVIYLLLPYAGVYGYIAVLYISELINLTMSAARLNRILGKKKSSDKIRSVRYTSKSAHKFS